MSTIREEFLTYDRDVVPADAGTVQRRETERAFYSGALVAVLLARLARLGSSPTDIDARLDALHEEIHAWVNRFRD